jgi:hypothetical protein
MSAPQLVKRHPAGIAHYRGDVRVMLGEIKGPNTYGGYVVATAAIYDPETGLTEVAFSHCRPEDLERAVTNENGLACLPGVTVGGEQ